VQVACTINYDRKSLWKKWKNWDVRFSFLIPPRRLPQDLIFMTLQEKILYHQIHPLKLIADIGCEPISLYFFWQRDLLLGLATHFAPPVAASLWLIRYADLETYKTSAGGAFLRRHMTRAVEAIRLAGDLLLMVGAWMHRPWMIAFGLAVIVLAWGSGLLGKPR
jgi:hypothetical protein